MPRTKKRPAPPGQPPSRGGRGRTRVLSPSEDELFSTLVKGGAHPKEIRRRLGLHARKIDLLARERGLVVVRRSDALQQRFIALWDSEAPIQQIASEMNLTFDSVRKRRSALGLAPRRQDYAGNARWSAAEVAELKKLYTRGATARDVALALGRGQHAVVTQVKRQGLQRQGARGRTPPGLLAIRLRECLERHGPSPSWRLRDYTQAPNNRVLATALQKLARAGVIERVGPRGRTGLWRLVKSAPEVRAELAPRPNQENDV